MGNEHSATSLMLRQHLGIGRKMSKAQSSTVLSAGIEEGSAERSPISNCPAPAIELQNDQSKNLNGGAYIKKQRNGRRKQSHGVEGRMMGRRGGTNGGQTQQKEEEKRGETEQKKQPPGDGATDGGTAKNAKDANSTAKQRKASAVSEFLLTVEQQQKKRIRSTSICTAQMKAAECQVIANLSYQHALAGDGLKNGRKFSSSTANGGAMPPLTRLRIQQCFRNAKSAIGPQILKRASALRAEFKSFIGHLQEEKADELANDIFSLITECVANIELPSKVAATSFAFGEMHAQLCHFGFRPEFFSTIADATIAECLRLDAGTQKRCETLLAWSQLMQFMFSNVRDGYYAEVRQQRRSSLPQQRLLLKQCCSSSVGEQSDAA
ncbi:hypothetical protein niasHT_010833 [Heterodera trifolii]|uniref:Uncharacterized protein n=1 Tax=Heterodera trifolii TaxID=157864 RepID=A0ABD2KVN9_9BILA